MNFLGKSSQGTAPGGQQVKKRRGASGAEESETKVLELLATLCLSNAQMVRGLKSTAITAHMMDKGNTIITMAEQAKKHYAKTVETMTPKQKDAIGPSHIHVWAGVCSAAKMQLQDFHKQNFDDYLEQMNKQGPISLGDHVKYCYTENCHDPDKKKLLVNVKEGTVADKACETILIYIRQAKGTRWLQGKAPRGDLEHQIQKWLDEQKGNMDI